MDPKIIKRGAIVLSIIVIIIVLSVACNALQNDDTTPTVSDQDGVFMSYDGYDVTNQDLYEKIKVMDGLVHLQNYIDRELLSDYIDDVEDAEIDDATKELTYGTTDDAEIDEISAREKEELEQTYHDTLVMNGYDPDDEESVESFVRLQVAKENYALDQFMDEDSDFAISDEDLEDYYGDYKQGDLQAIMLRFSSSRDVKNVLNRFNLVPNYEGGLGLYDPSENDDTPIEDVASDGFDEDNTTELDDEEALEYYIEMYNYLYPYRDSLPEDATIQDLVDADNDHLLFNQYDMQKAGEGRGGNNILDLSEYLYHTMDEDDQTHSRQSRSIGDYRFMFYLLDREEVTPYEDLSDSELDDLKVEYFDNLVGEEQVQEVMRDLYDEEDLAIHDKMIANSFEQQTQDEDVYEETEDTSTLATLDSLTVSVDDYFDYASEKVGAFYSLEVLKEELLLESSYFEDTFGDNRDVFENRSDRMKSFREHVRNDKSRFNNGAYQQYGFSPEEMDWEDFLFQAYGLADEEEYLTTLALENIRNDYLLDEVEFDKVMDYVDDQYENYFSLKADQLLIFVDMDEDFNPDDFNEYYDSMSDSEQDDFDKLKNELEEEVEDAIDDGQSLEDVVEEYKDASRVTDEDDEDYSVWAQFKVEGITIKYENLAVTTGQQQQQQQEPEQEENLDYNNTTSYVEEFVAALKDLYDDYNTAENEDKDELFANRLTTTQFGIHMIRAEKGDAFEQPTAAFDNEDGDYSSDLENDEAVPTLEQVRTYSEMRVEKAKEETVGGSGELDYDTMPEELFNAIDTYASQSYGRLFNNINHSIHAIDTIEDDVTFNTDHDHHHETLITIQDLFDRRTFPPIEDEFNND
ncbi:MAG: hypothetical protein ACOCU5_00100 [Bacillota bacterium]